MKILIPHDFNPNLERLISGTPISNYYHIKHLAQACELHVFSAQDQLNRELRDTQTADMPEESQKYGEITTDIQAVRVATPHRRNLESFLNEQAYDGILLLTPRVKHVMRFTASSEAPLLVRAYAIRGYYGSRTNTVLACYRALRLFDGIAPISLWAKEYLLRYVCREDCFYTIPCGVDLDFFRPMDKEECKKQVAERLKDDRILKQPVVGMLSRFQPEKGSALFLKAARLNKDILFMAVGKVCADYSKLLPDNLIIPGKQPRRLLPTFYNAFDVYCFPSLVGTESFGLTVLEAMACGLPCVVTDFDGVPEVVGDTGLKVPVTEFRGEIAGFAVSMNPYELSQRIRYLINNPDERRCLGQKARKRAETLSWDAVAQEIIQTFEILKEKKLAHSYERNGSRINFTADYIWQNDTMVTKCLLSNTPLRMPEFELKVEEGLALSLLLNHTIGEVEAILMHLTQSKERTKEILEKVIFLLENYPPSPCTQPG